MLAIEELRRRVRALRQHFELTQQEVANLAVMDLKYYQDLEYPRKKNWFVHTVGRLAEVYGMDEWQFMHPEFMSFAKRPKPALGHRPKKQKQA